MTTAAGTTRRTITLERIYQAPLEDVWEQWTTPAGLEGWWGPEGFTVKVHALDLRAGGALTYAMTATAPEQAAFMKRAGMPLTTEGRITYDEVAPQRRLAFTHRADFIPGVEAYDVATVVELSAVPEGTRVVLTTEVMHDEVWTQRAVQGWKSQLSRLAAVVAG